MFQVTICNVILCEKPCSFFVFRVVLSKCTPYRCDPFLTQSLQLLFFISARFILVLWSSLCRQDTGWLFVVVIFLLCCVTIYTQFDCLESVHSLKYTFGIKRFASSHLTPFSLSWSSAILCRISFSKFFASFVYFMHFMLMSLKYCADDFAYWCLHIGKKAKNSSPVSKKLIRLFYNFNDSSSVLLTLLRSRLM